jgi:hypothetical protein
LEIAVRLAKEHYGKSDSNKLVDAMGSVFILLSSHLSLSGRGLREEDGEFIRLRCVSEILFVTRGLMTTGCHIQCHELESPIM